VVGVAYPFIMRVLVWECKQKLHSRELIEYRSNAAVQNARIQ
jgi:hypothetical protein